MAHINKWTLAGAGALVALTACLALTTNAYLGLVAALLLIGLGLIALIVQATSPVLGVAVLLVTAVVLPLEFPGPSQAMVSSSFLLAACLCGVWIVHIMCVPRVAGSGASGAVYALIAFLGITILSFLTGQFMNFRMEGAPLPAQIAQLGLFLLSGFLFLAVTQQISSISQLKWLTWIFIGAGTATCLTFVVPMLNSIATWTTRPMSVGSLFWTWLVAMSFSQALFNQRLSTPVRAGLLVLNGLVLFHGLVQVSSWVSGWAPVLAALGVITLFRVPRITFGLSLMGAFGGAVFGGQVLDRVLAEESYSLLSRQEAWEVLWQLFARSPVIGTGPANYYYEAASLPLLGWYVPFFSHNTYQDLLLQVGLAGFLAFAWFIFELFRTMLRMAPKLDGGFERAYIVGAIGGLSGSVVAGFLGDWIIPFYYNAGILGFRSSLLFWVFLGGVLALARISRVHQRRQVFDYPEPYALQSDSLLEASPR